MADIDDEGSSIKYIDIIKDMYDKCQNLWRPKK